MWVEAAMFGGAISFGLLAGYIAVPLFMPIVLLLYKNSGGLVGGNNFRVVLGAMVPFAIPPIAVIADSSLAGALMWAHLFLPIVSAVGFFMRPNYDAIEHPKLKVSALYLLVLVATLFPGSDIASG